MNRVIHKVQPTIQAIPQRKRVAAYARVSSDKESMVESLAAQVGYYSAHIQRNPQWNYVGVYADAYTLYGLTPKACLPFNHRVVGINLSQICVLDFFEDE